MSNYTVPAPCPHCGVEVAMVMEASDNGEEGQWYQSFYVAVGIAADDEQEYEEHKCVLTADDINKMCDVATARSGTEYYRNTAGEEDY